MAANFASRTCSPDNLIREGQVARGQATWLSEADYNGCGPDPTDQWVKLDSERDARLFSSLADELERVDRAIDPYNDPDLLEQWTLCIGNIMSHQEANYKQVVAPTSSPAWCPIMFDGWRCWPATRAGEVAYVGCPSRVQTGFSAKLKAHKICTPEGDWYRHPESNRYWSNYTTCIDKDDFEFRRMILNIYVTGNLISLIALSASLIIFVSFKSLNCTRVTIHKNLFLSFITNNLMWIIWYTYVVNDADLLKSNPIQCQFWHILLHYFLVCNYFWMFCEGLYLHTLLVVAFVSEDRILKWFYLLGWLTPIPIIVAYAYERSYDEYYTNFCWMEESPYNLILMAPIGISLLLNLIFLINIVRVLVTKLRANNSPDAHQTRKAVRATLILIPLLGLHYILTPFRPEAQSEWEKVHEIFAAISTSFQGLCVALLFCFCNGEVIIVIKKKLKNTFNLGRRSGGEPKRASRANAYQHNGSTTTTTAIPQATCKTSQLEEEKLGLQANNYSGRTNGTNSNSSSLITAVTASPIQQESILFSQASSLVGNEKQLLHTTGVASSTTDFPPNNSSNNPNATQPTLTFHPFSDRPESRFQPEEAESLLRSNQSHLHSHSTTTSFSAA